MVCYRVNFTFIVVLQQFRNICLKEAVSINDTKITIFNTMVEFICGAHILTSRNTILYTLLENVPSAVSHLPSRTPEVNSVITCCLEKLRSRVQTRCYEGTIMGFLLHVVIFLFFLPQEIKAHTRSRRNVF